MAPPGAMRIVARGSRQSDSGDLQADPARSPPADCAAWRFAWGTRFRWGWAAARRQPRVSPRSHWPCISASLAGPPIAFSKRRTRWKAIPTMSPPAGWADSSRQLARRSKVHVARVDPPRRMARHRRASRRASGHQQGSRGAAQDLSDERRGRKPAIRRGAGSRFRAGRPRSAALCHERSHSSAVSRTHLPAVAASASPGRKTRDCRSGSQRRGPCHAGGRRSRKSSNDSLCRDSQSGERSRSGGTRILPVFEGWRLSIH